MKISFKRITSTGSFIPEIDGLRFIAIASVVFYHLNAFYIKKDFNHYTDTLNFSILKKILSHGFMGVPLFFVISGFILGMPFAKYHINNEKKVNIKKYFLRRLTRLEPPYILIMTVLLFGAVYVAKTLSFHDGLASYFSSIIYSHTLIYPGELPFLNVVAWSLEIEVQFYILAPVLAYIFTIKSVSKRRIFLLSLILLFLVINRFNTLPFRCLINFIQFFLVGFLLVDMYVSKTKFLPKTKFDFIYGFFFFSIIWLFDQKEIASGYLKFTWELIQISCIFFLYYYVLFHKIFRLLSLKFITNIGGMCYTIYLVHSAIISMIGNPLLKHSFSKYSFINISVYTIVLLAAVTGLSSIYFLLVERPCMDKDWVKKLFKLQTKIPVDVQTVDSKTRK